jgi:hypothetical protein
MLISELIEQLNGQMERHGDLEVTMKGTLLSEGFSQTNNKNFPDVFESTVETLMLVDNKTEHFDKRIQIFWQC